MHTRLSTNLLVAPPIYWYIEAMAARTRSSSTLEQVLGTQSKVAVLRTLLQSKAGYSGSAIASRTGMALFAVQRSLATLENIGLVDVERGSVENRYRLNARHYLVANGLRRLFEGERNMPNMLARELSILLEGKVIAAGLFGSFARGEAGEGSDIDLFVVVPTIRDEERVTRILLEAQTDLDKRFGLPIQAVIFNKRRVTTGLRRGEAFFTEVERDWRHVAGLTPSQIRKSAA